MFRILRFKDKFSNMIKEEELSEQNQSLHLEFVAAKEQLISKKFY